MSKCNISIGYDPSIVLSDFNDYLDLLEDSSIDFIVPPLFHPRLSLPYTIQKIESKDNDKKFKTKLYKKYNSLPRSDFLASNSVWSTRMIGKMSHRVDLDNKEEDYDFEEDERNDRKKEVQKINEMNKKNFKEEISWCFHTGMKMMMFSPSSFHSSTSILSSFSSFTSSSSNSIEHNITSYQNKNLLSQNFPSLPYTDNSFSSLLYIKELNSKNKDMNGPINLGETLKELCNLYPLHQIIINLPVVLPINLNQTFNFSSSSNINFPFFGTNTQDEIEGDSFYYWQNLHKLTNYSKNLCVALEFSREIEDSSYWTLDLIKKWCHRWISENLKFIILPISLFNIEEINENSIGNNKEGHKYDIKLSYFFIKLIKIFSRYNINIIIKGKTLTNISSSDSNIKNNLINKLILKDIISYITDIHMKEYLSMKSINLNTQYYFDCLQLPLQPLADHLESYTYEVFEKDKDKYIRYEKAIEENLKIIWEKKNNNINNKKLLSNNIYSDDDIDEHDNTKNNIENNEEENNDISNLSENESESNSEFERIIQSDDEEIEEENDNLVKKIKLNKNNKHNKLKNKILLLVVGAGRGPLIQAALNASSNLNIPIKIIALEKNPMAIHTLKLRGHNNGWFKKNSTTNKLKNKVKLIYGNMKTFNFNNYENDLKYYSNKIDLVISELLGSFGDNEGSPDCLDFSEKFFLKKNKESFSIPANYVSYIEPIQSKNLWLSARETSKHLKDILKVNEESCGLEVPYVVKAWRGALPSTPLPVWEFIHPRGVGDGKLNGKDNERYIFMINFLIFCSIIYIITYFLFLELHF